MSEQAGSKISNVEVLLDKVLGFQGTLTNVRDILNTIEVTEKPGIKKFATLVPK